MMRIFTLLIATFAFFAFGTAAYGADPCEGWTDFSPIMQADCIDDIRDTDADAAMGMATAAIPTSDKAFTIGAGVAHYEGETAFAVGLDANVFDRVSLSADAAYAQESEKMAFMLSATISATDMIAVKAVGSYADDKMGFAAGVSVAL